MTQLASEVFVSGPPNYYPRSEVQGPGCFDRSNGNHIVRLRGWLQSDDGINEADPDWHLTFVPDDAYLTNTMGADLHTFPKLGDILSMGIKSAGDCYAVVAIPAIHVELNGWTAPNPPSGWPMIPGPSGKQIWWPFDPRIDPSTGKPWDGITYVEITGALITDEPHYDDPGTCGGVARIWSGNADPHDMGNIARWTELHPPDSIRSVPWTDIGPGTGYDGALQGLAVCSNSVGVEKQARIEWYFGAGTIPSGPKSGWRSTSARRATPALSPRDAPGAPSNSSRWSMRMAI